MTRACPLAAFLVAVALAAGVAPFSAGPLAAQTQQQPQDRGQERSTAATIEEVAPLAEALGIDELMPIMRDEGLDYGADLARDMFPGRGGDRWTAQVGRIYDTERMRREMERGMAARLEPGTIDALLQFFESDLGRRIVGLELSARRALLDPGVEEASEEAAAELEASGDPRFELLQSFVEANELVEMNVVGALNSNWAFYQGLDAGGAFDGQLTEEQMLADVWAQEEQIRAETRGWVYAYLGMAYQPLSDDELAAYTAMSETPEGEALNAALFAAFDEMFTRISRELGLAAATFMAGEDI
ncbi:MAG: DUF2059 domain-containing protein [Paracoccaceae bacterium]|jgi:hypothetical protein|nr:DUF2059 domain-containing protein [Paracoccaceae bacterium]